MSEHVRPVSVRCSDISLHFARSSKTSRRPIDKPPRIACSKRRFAFVWGFFTASGLRKLSVTKKTAADERTRVRISFISISSRRLEWKAKFL